MPIPRSMLIGEENRRRYHAAITLDFERAGIDMVTRSAEDVRQVIDYARRTERNGQRLSADPAIRSGLLTAYRDARITRGLALRVLTPRRSVGRRTLRPPSFPSTLGWRPARGDQGAYLQDVQSAAARYALCRRRWRWRPELVAAGRAPHCRHNREPEEHHCPAGLGAAALITVPPAPGDRLWYPRF
jgi:alkylation response protein AidB-like acyl-CoA dehydrogenase